ncbi:MAG: prephenate dehydratase [bacterium]
MRIITLGPKGTFSHEAVIGYLEQAEIIFKHTVWDVFEGTAAGEGELGMVPIENSITGSVGFTLDAFLHFSLYMKAETVLPIKHNLAGRGGLDGIKVIYAHPQTHAQCKTFLRTRLAGAEIIETSSNARSAEMLLEQTSPEYAAIVPAIAAQIYHLTLLEKNIQDSKFNVTRFAVIAEEDTRERTGRDKTSLVVYPVADRPGILCEMLEEFRVRNINLTKIESRPSGKLGDYIFYIDFEGHRTDSKVAEALQKIEGKAAFLKILGSYPKMC